MIDERIGRPGAVIFDCDGVLVDSEGLMNREFRTMLGEIGLSYTAEETTRTFMGRSMKSCLQIVETQLGHAVPDDFFTVLDQRANAVFARDLAQPATRRERLAHMTDLVLGYLRHGGNTARAAR